MAQNSAQQPVLHVVHCIDTEGPLTESLEATFQRLRATFGLNLPANAETLSQLQRRQLQLGGVEDAVARMVSPALLAYNSNWTEIRSMLDEALSIEFRDRMRDDFGNGWVYSWHCMDHVGYTDNPRRKDVGYGNIFRFYRQMLDATNSNDEINWHFHPVSITGNPLNAATSYTNSFQLLNELISRRILEDNWFPVVNRPGFHSERPDSHAFLEQWMPFDFANQSHEEDSDQPDLGGGRFGDWRRAPRSWRGYHPHHDDYQRVGACRRKIFRCLNVGTRVRTLNERHVQEAYAEAREQQAAILAFANHDYRDIRADVENVRAMLAKIKPRFPDVQLHFSGAEYAARKLSASGPDLHLSMRLEGNRLVITVDRGEVFGPQPFLALQSKEGRYFHDNLDVQEPNRVWSYVLDDQTLPPSALECAGVGAAGRYGGFHVARLKIA